MATTIRIYEGEDAIEASVAFLKLASRLPSLKDHRVPLMHVFFGGGDFQYFQWGNFVLSNGQKFRIYLGPYSTAQDATLKPKDGGEHGPWCLYNDEDEGCGEGARIIERISVLLRRYKFNPLY